MKKLWLFSCILIAAVVSCQRGLDIDVDQDDPNENTEEERIQFDYDNIAVLGSLGPWLDEIMLSTESTYSTVGSETELVFTDVSQLIAQADGIFEAYENGAFIAVVDPDFSQMAASLSDWAEEMRLSPEDDTDDSPVFYAFGKNGMFITEKTLFYEGAVRDSLGNEIVPESYTPIDECDYLSCLNSFAEWLAGGFDTESSEETKASNDDRKPSALLNSDKERIHVEQPFKYDVLVGDYTWVTDNLRTRGNVTLSADFTVTPMFGIDLGSGSDEGNDYYYVRAIYGNSFGNVPQNVALNFRSELSADDLRNRSNGLCLTYTCDYHNSNDCFRKFLRGDDVHDYVYKLRGSSYEYHVCGPMQSQFSFYTSLDLYENKAFFFDVEQGAPIPETTIGSTDYEVSKTYTFGANLSIGMESNVALTTEGVTGGGDFSLGADFNWGKQETANFRYTLQDCDIRRLGMPGYAGWVQQFNNLPTCGSGSTFSRGIPAAALSNGEQPCSWIWCVPQTKRNSTNSIGCLKTYMSIRMRILANAFSKSHRDVSWDIGTTLSSRPIHCPSRQLYGMVAMKNSIKNSTIKDICFISKESGKRIYVALGGNSGGNVNARIFEGKSIHFRMPEGTYSVQYTVERFGTRKIVTIDNQTVLYNEPCQITLIN